MRSKRAFPVKPHEAVHAHRVAAVLAAAGSSVEHTRGAKGGRRGGKEVNVRRTSYDEAIYGLFRWKENGNMLNRCLKRSAVRKQRPIVKKSTATQSKSELFYNKYIAAMA